GRAAGAPAKPRWPRTASRPAGRSGARTTATRSAPRPASAASSSVRRSGSPPAAPDPDDDQTDEDDEGRLDDDAGEEDGARLRLRQHERRQWADDLGDALVPVSSEDLLA